MSGILTVMTLGVVALAVLAVAGVAFAWGVSRLMDAANGRSFYRKGSAARWSGILNTIEGDAQACALYYGLRWLGICILIGWLFSRAV